MFKEVSESNKKDNLDHDPTTNENLEKLYEDLQGYNGQDSYTALILLRQYSDSSKLTYTLKTLRY